MKLDKINIATKYNHLEIREIRDDGRYHRRSISSDKDISKEDPKIQEMAEKVWTNEVKEKWAEYQDKIKPKDHPED
tara:strand:+ start:3733 stop:3960 length:228 start_codon:yes stop_codon:yes gene_type:complete